ncbi:hypothetical protein JIG36_06030 [Actinoplanes sp. LDG1-06]|uniref:Uncharacterized protein n=1 Tax=Paractinoplanes ovalisporus TaxID=2810368 RepID=A0ABS2A5J7_9ACTN|nr:hypothetical protein [Actinoplanes ovalisporus]MBM2615118.1 hypothetical protein [Actinoplanes ovalisporus]
MLLLAAVATAFVAPVTASAAESCTAASSATFRHTFNGNSGKTTISSVRPLCPGQTQAFAMIAYTAGTGNAGQFVYSTDRASITSSRRSVSLDVVVPPCNTQVTAILGNELLDEVTSTDNPYGARTLGTSGSRSSGTLAHYRGGSAECQPQPRVAFTNACDGSFQATLSNAASANVSAGFLVSGRLTRLAPGRSTTVPAPIGGSLTIRDSSFTTYVGTWRPPASGCTTGNTPPPAATAPTAAPPVPPSVAVPPAASAPQSGTTTATADAPAAVYVTPTPTPETTATALKKAMSTSSVIAIAFGLVLIGGGSILLVRVIKSLRDPA